jgi:hypothetical protein
LRIIGVNFDLPTTKANGEHHGEEEKSQEEIQEVVVNFRIACGLRGPANAGPFLWRSYA